MAEKEYRKLPGKGMKRRAFLDIVRIRAQVWMGRDHLLYQLSTGYTEDYKRFYYKDIQAVTIRKTKRFLIWSLVLPLLAFICAVSGYNSEPFRYAYWVAAAFFFLFFLIHFSLGPTCICRLHTYVSTEEIYSWKRVRTVRKAIAVIAPLIEASQGSSLPVAESPAAGPPVAEPVHE
jgi:hypothetical protein